MSYLGWLVHTKNPRPKSMEQWLQSYKIDKQKEPDPEPIISEIDLYIMQKNNPGSALVDQYGKPLS